MNLTQTYESNTRRFILKRRQLNILHSQNTTTFKPENILPYILESNPRPFYSFRGLKNQMRIRIACGLDSQSWTGFWKNDIAAVRTARTKQYNNLLFYLFIILYDILYNIYSLLFIRPSVITHNWINLPCRQGTVEGKVLIRTANYFRLRNRQKLVRIRFENIRYLQLDTVCTVHFVEFYYFN